MHNDIITQNIKLIDEKLIIIKKSLKLQMMLNIQFFVSREFEPAICERCGCVVYKIKEYKIRTVKTFINYDYPVLLKYKQRR